MGQSAGFAVICGLYRVNGSVTMWFLLALLGVLSATALADAMLTSNTPEAEADDPPPPTDDLAGNGDLLRIDGADGGADGGALPDSALTPSLPTPVAGGDGPLVDDSYISTDTPGLPVGLTLQAGDSGEALFGGAAGDTLIGGAGADLLHGGDGDDLLIGNDGNDTLWGGAGADSLDGGAGDDLLIGGPGQNTLLGGAGDDWLLGGEDADRLIGGPGNDTLEGGWGDDWLEAGGGDNLLMGGAGNDTLIGADLSDDLVDSGGVNFLNGGDGEDVLILGRGDVASGGAGRDTFVLGEWLDPSAPVTITDFIAGSDQLVFAHLLPTGGAPAPVLGLRALADGGQEVLMDGEVIARLQGSDGLTLADIRTIAIAPGTSPSDLAA